MQFGTDIENVQSSMNNRSSTVSMPTCDIRRRSEGYQKWRGCTTEVNQNALRYMNINVKQGGYVYGPLQFIAHRIVLSLESCL